MKGSGLKVNEIKEFLQSSYDVDASKNLLGYFRRRFIKSLW